ncbi:alpha/beta fold hydrolase [Bacillus subtilis]|uniref:thioesterase II family protein n=1 Tax=Bacillus subtilis TaxID=1423 RepID=UPI001D0988A4|nr:alpha/beta fold hydrolase [Bacillus subtilis]MCB7162457.1 alpha/beta fold hydrolase [Bacillus subtilis]MCB7461326.1 alpha/beta fold hydrolase [Bacillus subtilis]
MVSHIVKKLTSNKVDKGNLICFPFAGGHSSSFRPLSQLLETTGWSILAIEPPGHGNNRMPLIEDVTKMVDLYERALSPIFTKPFAFFGHSLGGFVAYLLTQRLEKIKVFPQALIISSTNPPGLVGDKKAGLSDKEFLDYVVSLGGIPNELLEQKEFIEFFLRILRADFKALETYVHRDYTTIQTPVYIFGGDQDKESNFDMLQEWVKWVYQAEFYTFRGGHMYLHDQVENLANKIHEILNENVRN